MKNGIYIAGSAAGAAIPLILREYVDKSTPTTATFDWKKPSVLVGVGGGAAAMLLGLFGGRFLPSTIQDLFVAMGPAMIVTGAYSAMFPKSSGTAGFSAPVRLSATSTPITIVPSTSSASKIY